jgi:hypothetical protein
MKDESGRRRRLAIADEIDRRVKIEQVFVARL